MAYNDIHGLEKELLDLIIDVCERNPEDAKDMEIDSPILGPDSALGLDSLDSVEIVSLIHSNYGVRITSVERSIEVLSSLKTIAEYINANQ